MNVILRLTARSDTAAALQPLLIELARKSRRERGCLSYQILQNSADPCELTLVETWASEAALDTHLKTAHVQEAWAKGLPLLAAEPDMRRYTAINPIAQGSCE